MRNKENLRNIEEHREILRNTEKCKELQINTETCSWRNTEKCKGIQRNIEKCRKTQRNIESIDKHRETERNTEKLRETQNNNPNHHIWHPFRNLAHIGSFSACHVHLEYVWLYGSVKRWKQTIRQYSNLDTRKQQEQQACNKDGGIF